ncbi:MAG TPA: hypothetical protein VIX37_17625 [Candidatus Sulfotelmatobacter sp.]
MKKVHLLAERDALCKILSFLSQIVVLATEIDGDVWTNPHCETFCKRAGKVWVYHYYKTRDTDGHRVENTVVVGALSSLPREKDAWAEVEHRGLNRNHELGLTGRVMFGDLARHYINYELGELAEADDQKSHTTIERYLQILNNRLIPRWGNRAALELEPLEIMQWLKASKRMENLENPTVDKIRRVMNLVFKHGQTYGLIPRTGEANPMTFVRVGARGKGQHPFPRPAM